MTVNARTIALALATSGFFDSESPGEKRATALKFQRPPKPAKRLTAADLNRIEAADPVQGEATVKESLTVDLVENSTYGGLHIKEWHNHGLSAGRHTLYTSPAKPDAELVELLRDARRCVMECADQDAGGPTRREAQSILARIDAKLAELQK